MEAGALSGLEIAAKIARVRDWLPQLGLPIMGYAYIARIADAGQIAALLLISSLYLLQGYILNSYNDRDIDSREKNPLAAAEGLRLPTALALALIIAILLAASWLVSWQMLFLITFGVIVGFLYSARPFRLKRFILPRLALNSCGFMILFAAGCLAASGALELKMIFSGVVFLLMVLFELVHICAHRREDRLSSRLSGEKRSISLAYAAAAILTLISLVLLMIGGTISPGLFALTLSFAVAMSILAGEVIYKGTHAGTARKMMRFAAIAYGIIFILIG